MPNTKSRNFQDRFDSVLRQARHNVNANPSFDQQELLMALLVEIMDIRYEIQEIRAERDEKARRQLEIARQVLGR